jgi:hypothetical protein
MALLEPIEPLLDRFQFFPKLVLESIVHLTAIPLYAVSASQFRFLRNGALM